MDARRHGTMGHHEKITHVFMGAFKADIQPFSCIDLAQTFWPFNQQNPPIKTFFQPNLIHIVTPIEAVKVGMMGRDKGLGVMLDQREGGAWDVIKHPKASKNGPGEHGFACTQITGKSDQVTWQKLLGKKGAKMCDGLFIKPITTLDGTL